MPDTPTHPLFTADDLTELLGKSVAAGRAAMAEQVVWGWLQPLLGIQERPEELTPQQFSWAIQLGAIAHENPSGLSSKQVGAVSVQYSKEAREAILAEVAGSTNGRRPGAPRGRFPKARRYPDPVERC